MENSETSKIEKHSHWAVLVLPVAWMIAIYLASDQPKLPSPPGIPGFDKIAHFGAYGLLATLWARAFFRPGRPRRAALLGLTVASLYGVSDEFHQSFTPGRSTELADWVADTAGAALAVAVYCFWPAYRAFMDRRIVRMERRSAVEAAASIARDQAT